MLVTLEGQKDKECQADSKEKWYCHLRVKKLINVRNWEHKPAELQVEPVSTWMIILIQSCSNLHTQKPRRLRLKQNNEYLIYQRVFILLALLTHSNLRLIIVIEWSTIWPKIKCIISKSNKCTAWVWFEITSMIWDQNLMAQSLITSLFHHKIQWLRYWIS